MKISEILQKNDVTLSFEVFPPKVTANYEAVQKAAYGVAKLKPSYMSVTYGAGGSTRGNTLKIARGIQEEYGVTTIAHLTCVGTTREGIRQSLEEMRAAGIENVLALRGDRPKDFEGEPLRITITHQSLRQRSRSLAVCVSVARVIRRGTSSRKTRRRTFGT